MKNLISENLEEKLTPYKPTEEITGLHCDKCDNDYTLFKFTSGYEYRDGCECSMIEQAKQEKKARKQKFIDSIFNQSTTNKALKQATVNNYQPHDETQKKAKATAIEYVKTFDKDNGKSLIMQGTYGTGKSHLAYAIAKAVKSQGYTVAFMHIPMLMERIKTTYNKGAAETTDQLVKELSNLDLLVLDDVGVENTEHTLNKLFSIVDNRVGKNNIYTTNFSDKELNQNQNWQRINSRMKQNARKVKVLGPDYREVDSW